MVQSGLESCETYSKNWKVPGRREWAIRTNDYQR